ncbi:hypothetical protein C9374_013081 [Naegleria lovaniensis]|uniref:Guanine nucleotide-binding protein subunit beta-like protein n=1 Tax=Naegleria lovaniensis TaxID=51637 RepID=A0AA88KDE8_NAELO|nr:uncharacterized protein C9374_013081 [Naegleria lovaniensis]KAG2372874.1 hypothetical protein C9374_013081 [Naegleria lovaniensis]
MISQHDFSSSILPNSDERNKYEKYHSVTRAISSRNHDDSCSSEHIPIFEKKLYMGPVYCINFSKIIPSVLYAGIGPNLHIFETHSGREIGSIAIFEKGGSIKGIKFIQNEECEEQLKTLHNFDLLSSSSPLQNTNSMIEEFIIYGQKRLKIVQLLISLNRNENTNDVFATIEQCQVWNFGEMCDWILDVLDIGISINSDEHNHDRSMRTLCVGYAHNFIQLLSYDHAILKMKKDEFRKYIHENTTSHQPQYSRNIQESNQHLNLLATRKSYPNCLLYSMSLFFNRNGATYSHGDSTSILNSICENISVASGTVFNTVIIWNCKHNTKESVVQLQGHNGVIFHVEWSDDGKHICSTSDDRTLILWKFNEQPLHTISHHADSNQVSETYTSTIFYGHNARVWHCKFTKHFIISASEDATIRVWDYDGNCVSTLQGHIGRNVWRIDIDSTQQVIASGGGDSSVKLWSLKRIQDYAIVHQNFELPQMTVPQNQSKKQADMVRCMHAMNQHIYVGTKKGFVYQVNILNGNYSPIFNANMVAEMGSAVSSKESPLLCVVRCSPCEQFICIGNSAGYCCILDISTGSVLSTFKAMSSRILAVFWVKNLDHSFTLYFSSPLGTMKAFGISFSHNFEEMSLNESSSSSPAPSVSITEGTHYLVKGKIQALCAVRDERILITGDDEGFIHVLRASQNTTPDEKTPEFVMKTAHADQVCDIKYVNRETIYSVGRDGSICFYHLIQDENNGMFTLVKHQQERLKSVMTHLDRIFISYRTQESSEYQVVAGGCDYVDTIPASIFNKMESEILLIGFYGSHMIVYNYTKRYRIASCKCGASRGIYDFVYTTLYHTPQLVCSASFFRDSLIMNFVEKKQEEELALFKNQTPFIQFHGREVLNATHWKSGNDLRIVTCSEDTKIRILSYHDDSTSLKEKPWTESNNISTLSILNAHESSVKELSVVDYYGENSKILISGGGKEQLAIWKIEERDSSSSITTDLLLNINLTNQYLSLFHPQIYQDFKNRDKWSHSSHSIKTYHVKNKSRLDVINFRILSLDAFKCSTHSEELIILVGSSDGLVKVFSTQNQLRKLRPIAHSFLHNGPVLSLATVRLEDDHQRLIFSASTNGKLYCCMYDPKNVESCEYTEMNSNLNVLEAFFECDIHQSGVNCMHVHPLENDPSMIHVCTGGDDQSVNLAILKFDTSQQQLRLVSNVHLEGVHSSAVSGVFSTGFSSPRLTDMTEEQLNRLVLSIGIDQRLNVYSVSPHRETFEIIASCMSEVNDISHMHVIEEKDHFKVIIVGIGMQIISISKNALFLCMSNSNKNQ